MYTFFWDTIYLFFKFSHYQTSHFKPLIKQTFFFFDQYKILLSTKLKTLVYATVNFSANSGHMPVMFCTPIYNFRGHDNKATIGSKKLIFWMSCRSSVKFKETAINFFALIMYSRSKTTSCVYKRTSKLIIKLILI